MTLAARSRSTPATPAPPTSSGTADRMPSSTPTYRAPAASNCSTPSPTSSEPRTSRVRGASSAPTAPASPRSPCSCTSCSVRVDPGRPPGMSSPERTTASRCASPASAPGAASRFPGATSRLRPASSWRSTTRRRPTGGGRPPRRRHRHADRVPGQRSPAGMGTHQSHRRVPVARDRAARTAERLNVVFRPLPQTTPSSAASAGLASRVWAKVKARALNGSSVNGK